MALTYQPFAQIPDVDRVSHDLQMNVPESERLASAVLGAALATAGLARGGLARWVLLFAAGALIRRAITASCPLYRRLDLDRRHARSDVLGNREKRI